MDTQTGEQRYVLLRRLRELDLLRTERSHQADPTRLLTDRLRAFALWLASRQEREITAGGERP
jgi:hypothetical protein